jgi:hypothetical protein
VAVAILNCNTARPIHSTFVRSGESIEPQQWFSSASFDDDLLEHPSLSAARQKRAGYRYVKSEALKFLPPIQPSGGRQLRPSRELQRSV